ncbi:APC family permease [Lysobacter enzymogenes]|uniref:Amino acid transporter n=1 Tax=Lysobacter enzymogenes TaxID=69 RepID=A0AAU9AUK4_LYSEN|nr:APC family permease [Lysobacter enzymogenes]BAV97631.1 amino acid transporter [Lysobacter enzymogenes]
MDGKAETVELRKNALGWLQIVFFVIATNGPLIGLVGAVPVAIGMGNGVGTAGAFVLAGAAYLLFSVGFVAMSRHIGNAGAFYSYVTAGLGGGAGIVAAFLALAAYFGIQLACFAMIGFFLEQAQQQWLGAGAAWWINALAVAVLVRVCGYRNIEFSGRVLAVLMLCEIGIVLLFVAAVLVHGGGPEGFSAAPLLPSQVFSAGLGVSLVFVAGSYFGFETTAIYAEEARDPRRSIAIATYVALGAITVFLSLATWAITVAYGPQQVVAAAQADPGNFWFAMAATLTAPPVAAAMNALVITSLFASLLSLHNSVSRYLFAMGREGVLWRWLARVHPRQRTPSAAGATQFAASIACILAFAAIGADPMAAVLPVGSAVASISMLTVQVLASIAVPFFFLSRPLPRRPWTTVAAPLAAALVLAGLIALICQSLPLLAGGNAVFVVLIPACVIAVAAAAVVYAWWLWRYRGEFYRNLGQALERV